VELKRGLGDQRTFISDHTPPGTVFTIERDAKFGGPSHYSSFEEFREKKVHPGDLKASVTSGINRQLEPIRKAFEGDVECKRIEGLAYPEVGKVEKKKKVSDCQSD
jgi:tyrosyl-tRNA synthetase